MSTDLRQTLLARAGVRLLDSRAEGDPTETVDLLACAAPARRPCYVLAYWHAGALCACELFFTEAEARASLTHGPVYQMDDFALPPLLLHCLLGEEEGAVAHAAR